MENSFEYKGATITLVAPRKNKHRDLFRRVYDVVLAAGHSAGLAGDFATIVAYTEKVENADWTPPPATASAEELLAAYDVWYEDGDADLTDEWISAIYPPKNSTKGPEPLGPDADPKQSKRE